MKYTVDIVEVTILHKEITVEAESEEEAHKAAGKLYEEGEIEMWHDNTEEFHVLMKVQLEKKEEASE